MDPIEKLDCPVLAPLNTAGMATDPMSAWPMLAWFLWIMVALQKNKKIECKHKIYIYKDARM